MTEKLLKAGAAKLPISPTPDMLPLTLSFSGDLYEAVRNGEDISTRVIVLDNGEKRFAFISCELARVPAPEIVYSELMNNYGLSKNDILYTVTHNHAAPHPYDPPGAREINKYGLPDDESDNIKRWTRMVIDRIVEAVGIAIENLRPVRMGYAEDKSYININRDELFDDGYWMQGQNWTGVSDKTVAAVTFTDYSGNIVAAVVNYAVHDVMCFLAKDTDGKVKITCGIPGIASGWLEKYFGNDAVVLWQSGAAGNQNPYLSANKRYDINGTMYAAADAVPGASYINAIHVGEQHAIDCLRAIKKAAPTRDWVGISTGEMTILLDGQKFPEGIDPMYNRLMADNLLVSRGYFAPGEKYEKNLAEMIPIEDKVPMWSQLIILGDVAFFGVACELYNEIGLLCKEASPLKHTIIATHIGAKKVGYVLDNASKDHKVFQSFGQVRAGRSNELIVNGMLEMFKKFFSK